MTKTFMALNGSTMLLKTPTVPTIKFFACPHYLQENDPTRYFSADNDNRLAPNRYQSPEMATAPPAQIPPEMDPSVPDVNLPSAKVDAVAHIVEAFRLLNAATLEANIAEAVTPSDGDLPTGPKIRADDLKNLDNIQKSFELALTECLKDQMTFSFGEQPDREVLFQCMTDLKKEVDTSYRLVLTEMFENRLSQQGEGPGERNAELLEQTVADSLICWPLAPIVGSAARTLLALFALYIGGSHSPPNMSTVSAMANTHPGTPTQINSILPSSKSLSSTDTSTMEQPNQSPSIEDLMKIHMAHRTYGEYLYRAFPHASESGNSREPLLRMYDSTTETIYAKIEERLANPEDCVERDIHMLYWLLDELDDMKIEGIWKTYDKQ